MDVASGAQVRLCFACHHVQKSLHGLTATDPLRGMLPGVNAKFGWQNSGTPFISLSVRSSVRSSEVPSRKSEPLVIDLTVATSQGSLFAGFDWTFDVHCMRE